MPCWWSTSTTAKPSTGVESLNRTSALRSNVDIWIRLPRSKHEDAIPRHRSGFEKDSRQTLEGDAQTLISADSTDAEIHAAVDASKLQPKPASAIAASYVPESDQISVVFDSEIEVRFRRARLDGLEHASAEQLAKVIVTPTNWLLWPDLDVDHYLPQLMDSFANSCREMAEMWRVGGSKTSPAKATAASVNRRKGGRPRKRSVA
jgi:hypothetical protein